ncbi:MAG: hypothetical protein JWN40_3433 [Phycisphaerales bacterium]|nr:hypothetical protein [Phycisphaerales bacterium]
MLVRMGRIVLVMLLVLAPSVRAADAVTEAKRRAAADLMKEGKNVEAIALLSEVIKADGENYKDHLMMGRAYDKLNKPQEATESYHRVLELLPPGEDRAARAEVDRRLKVIDGQTQKIQAVEEEFLKKLDGLERESLAAHDSRAVERIWRIKGGIWSAQGRKDAGCWEVRAASEWHDTGMTLTQGQRYRIRAVGSWNITPGFTCSADGVADRPSGGAGAYGSLIAKVDTAPEAVAVGSNGTIVPTSTGKLMFISSMPTRADREKNSGSVFVQIQRE